MQNHIFGYKPIKPNSYNYFKDSRECSLNRDWSVIGQRFRICGLEHRNNFCKFQPISKYSFCHCTVLLSSDSITANSVLQNLIRCNGILSHPTTSGIFEIANCVYNFLISCQGPGDFYETTGWLVKSKILQGPQMKNIFIQMNRSNHYLHLTLIYTVNGGGG